MTGASGHDRPASVGSTPDFRPERVYVGYLALQAVLGIVLWVLLATSDVVRSGFELVQDQPEVTDAFVFADLGLVVVGSAVGAWAIEVRARCAVAAVWFTAGAILYPTFYLLVWVALVGTGSVALAVMIPTSTLTCFAAFQVYRLARRGAPQTHDVPA